MCMTYYKLMSAACGFIMRIQDVARQILLHAKTWTRKMYYVVNDICIIFIKVLLPRG